MVLAGTNTAEKHSEELLSAIWAAQLAQLHAQAQTNCKLIQIHKKPPGKKEKPDER